MPPNLIFYCTAALFFAMALAALWNLRWARRLPALETLNVGSAHAPIRCSVIIAARDEEARIEPTIRHVLAQRGVEVEIIVVDDRSTDRTPDILKRLADEDARVTFKRVEVLPDGWLGKCHACHLGAIAATGEWILFTDADCWLKPDVIQRALLIAERDGVEHVTLTPGTVFETHAARGWHLLFLTSLLGWISGANRDRPKVHIGIGAFNLVRTAAYRQCGGYEALRLTVIDDVRLGLLLRRAGKRTRAFLGGDDVECHWGSTVGNMVKIMEKNYFAAVNFNFWVVLVGSVFAIAIFGAVVSGLVNGTDAGLAAGLSPLSLMVPAGVLARRLGLTWPSAVCMPFMLPVFVYALLNSTWVTLRQGGVRWRDTLYPLKALRAGSVR